MASIFHSGLSKDLSLILSEADDFNVIIQVGDNQNIKEYQAHSVILRARSPYFKNLLSTKCITNHDNMIVLNNSNIAPNIFEMILRYMYMGELDLETVSCEDILELLVAADRLYLEELFKHIQDYLVEKQSTWVRQNSVLVLRTVTKFISHYRRLQDYCHEFICEDPKSLITSKDFPSLDKDILYELLQRDDLQIEEVVVWDGLIKWGIKQTPGLGNENSDINKWNSKDIEALRDTLSQFFPLIRFMELSYTYFFDKIRPYKAIVPDDIYEEVEEFYCKDIIPKTIILPPRTQRIESTIINPKLSSIIVSWIDRKVVRNIRNHSNHSRYRFDLIYRGSRDGIDNATFKNQCKGRVASLVLVKVKESDKIFGGYSSIGFGNKSYGGLLFYSASDNFIFSFDNREDIENMKMSRVVNHYKAILVQDNNGFNFGQGSLCMNDQDLYACNDFEYYENNLNTETIYTIEEIETYVVIKQ